MKPIRDTALLTQTDVGLPNTTAAMAQWVKALVPQAEGLVFESQPPRTKVEKTGSDSSNAKRSALGVNATGPRRLPL